MQLKNFQISNFKSFYSSREIPLSEGFNVIVGQNNAGKTAIVEALTISNFQPKPHQSPRIIQRVGQAENSVSEVKITFELSSQELRALIVKELKGQFSVHRHPDQTEEQATAAFLELFEQPSIRLEVKYSTSGPTIAHIPALDKGEAYDLGMQLQLESESSLPIKLEGLPVAGISGQLPVQLAERLRSRIYVFKAERINSGESSVSAGTKLQSDARNLPDVLHYLASTNLELFNRYNELVSTILPDVKAITVPPIADNRVRILVWNLRPDPKQLHLAIPLAESGTGISQVLAILYVVVTSEYPQVIIIDEPQSFLHPGALRKLLTILKQYYPQHQYVLTTHSPSVIASTNPQTLLIVHKEEAESVVDVISVTETDKLRSLLIEIGARLSDVFGVDDILWVEGKTEELCFPLIVNQIIGQPLLGTAILGVLNTGDFEGKHKTIVLQIYNRLSEGYGLLPPAIAFIFDRDGRNESDLTELTHRGRGKVVIIPRRMYENYLLNPAAITHLISLNGLSHTEFEKQDIQDWLEMHRWDEKFLRPYQVADADKTLENWLIKVHGAMLLEELFKEFTDHVPYDKVEHGMGLTKWIIESAPDDLSEIADLLKKILNTSFNE